MKEYKIIKQKEALLRNTQGEFEDELNLLARDGWHVVTSCFSTMNILTVILERNKNR